MSRTYALPAPSWYVYLAERKGLHQIGVSTNPEARARALRARLLAAAPATRATEKYINGRLAQYNAARVAGHLGLPCPTEWYFLSTDQMALTLFLTLVAERRHADVDAWVAWRRTSRALASHPNK